MCSTTQCIFNGEVWELKPKVRGLFSNFTIEKEVHRFFGRYLKIHFQLCFIMTIPIQMIKFFQKIRQNSLMENKTGKYLKYAIGEIVLVVIGILIALQINNWN